MPTLADPVNPVELLLTSVLVTCTDAPLVLPGGVGNLTLVFPALTNPLFPATPELAHVCNQRVCVSSAVRDDAPAWPGRTHRLGCDAELIAAYLWHRRGFGDLDFGLPGAGCLLSAIAVFWCGLFEFFVCLVVPSRHPTLAAYPVLLCLLLTGRHRRVLAFDCLRPVRRE